MEVKEKRILSKITYYALIVLTLVMAVAFIFALSYRVFPAWAKVVYFIWAGVVIATVIFDVMCTCSERMKFIAGVVVFVLSLAAVAMSIIIYLMYTTRIGLAMDLSPVFTLIVALSYATSLFLIAQFIVGESLIEHKTSAESLKQRGVRQ